MIDLATDGVRRVSSRSEVVTAVRRVMLSAIRAGWTYPEVHRLLTDTRQRKLARQLETGQGGRTIAKGKVNELLQRQWDGASRLVRASPAWDREDALAFVQTVRESLEASSLPDLDRAVIGIACDLAEHHGTTRPAIPVRTVVDRLSITRYRAHATLLRLAADGDWLDLAQRGDQRRANLYRLAPALRPGIAPAPASPTKETPDMPSASITLPLDPDDRDAVLALLAERHRAKAEAATTPANVVPFVARPTGTEHRT